MIIGITGTLGAGKGTVVEYLVREKGFEHFSVRDFLNKEIARRGMVSNRDAMTEVANDLRAAFGSGYITEQLLEHARGGGRDAVLESIRSVGEAQFLKSLGAALWAVDADISKRYERIAKRQSETDKISFEKFKSDEKREWENEDISKQNLKAVIAAADTVLTNNGGLEDLYQQVEVALQKA